MNLSSKVKKRIAGMLKKDVKDKDYFLQRYEVTGELVTGGYGTVYKVINRESREELAIKRIDLNLDGNYSSGESESISAHDSKGIHNFLYCCQEAILQSEVFSHPNVVRVYDKWIQPNSQRKAELTIDLDTSINVIVRFLESGVKHEGVHLMPLTADVRNALENTQGLSFYLTMDLCDTDLGTWLRRRDRQPVDADDIITNIIRALSYIHSVKNYAHLDLKPNNILLKFNKDKNSAKALIADFGLSKLIIPQLLSRNIGQSSLVARSPYHPAHDVGCSDKLDMWAFGLIVYQILSKQEVTYAELVEMCQRAKTEPESLLQYVERNIIPSINRSLIVRCLSVSASDRASSNILDNEKQQQLTLDAANAEVFSKVMEAKTSQKIRHCSSSSHGSGFSHISSVGSIGSIISELGQSQSKAATDFDGLFTYSSSSSSCSGFSYISSVGSIESIISELGQSQNIAATSQNIASSQNIAPIDVDGEESCEPYIPLTALMYNSVQCLIIGDDLKTPTARLQIYLPPTIKSDEQTLFQS